MHLHMRPQHMWALAVICVLALTRTGHAFLTPRLPGRLKQPTDVHLEYRQPSAQAVTGGPSKPTLYEPLHPSRHIRVSTDTHTPRTHTAHAHTAHTHAHALQTHTPEVTPGPKTEPALPEYECNDDGECFISDELWDEDTTDMQDAVSSTFSEAESQAASVGEMKASHVMAVAATTSARGGAHTTKGLFRRSCAHAFSQVKGLLRRLYHMLRGPPTTALRLMWSLVRIVGGAVLQLRERAWHVHRKRGAVTEPTQLLQAQSLTTSYALPQMSSSSSTTTRPPSIKSRPTTSSPAHTASSAAAAAAVITPPPPPPTAYTSPYASSSSAATRPPPIKSRPPTSPPTPAAPAAAAAAVITPPPPRTAYTSPYTPPPPPAAPTAAVITPPPPPPSHTNTAHTPPPDAHAGHTARESDAHTHADSEAYRAHLDRETEGGSSTHTHAYEDVGRGGKRGSGVVGVFEEDDGGVVVSYTRANGRGSAVVGVFEEDDGGIVISYTRVGAHTHADESGDVGSEGVLGSPGVGAQTDHGVDGAPYGDAGGGGGGLSGVYDHHASDTETVARADVHDVASGSDSVSHVSVDGLVRDEATLDSWYYGLDDIYGYEPPAARGEDGARHVTCGHLPRHPRTRTHAEEEVGGGRVEESTEETEGRPAGRLSDRRVLEEGEVEGCVGVEGVDGGADGESGSRLRRRGRGGEDRVGDVAGHAGEGGERDIEEGGEEAEDATPTTAGMDEDDHELAREELRGNQEGVEKGDDVDVDAEEDAYDVYTQHPRVGGGVGSLHTHDDDEEGVGGDGDGDGGGVHVGSGDEYTTKADVGLYDEPSFATDDSAYTESGENEPVAERGVYADKDNRDDAEGDMLYTHIQAESVSGRIQTLSNADAMDVRTGEGSRGDDAARVPAFCESSAPTHAPTSGARSIDSTSDEGNDGGTDVRGDEDECVGGSGRGGLRLSAESGSERRHADNGNRNDNDFSHALAYTPTGTNHVDRDWASVCVDVDGGGDDRVTLRSEKEGSHTHVCAGGSDGGYAGDDEAEGSVEDGVGAYADELSEYTSASSSVPRPSTPLTTSSSASSVAAAGASSLQAAAPSSPASSFAGAASSPPAVAATTSAPPSASSLAAASSSGSSTSAPSPASSPSAPPPPPPAAVSTPPHPSSSPAAPLEPSSSSPSSSHSPSSSRSSWRSWWTTRPRTEEEALPLVTPTPPSPSSSLTSTSSFAAEAEAAAVASQPVSPAPTTTYTDDKESSPLTSTSSSAAVAVAPEHVLSTPTATYTGDRDASEPLHVPSAHNHKDSESRTVEGPPHDDGPQHLHASVGEDTIGAPLGLARVGSEGEEMVVGDEATHTHGQEDTHVDVGGNTHAQAHADGVFDGHMHVNSRTEGGADVLGEREGEGAGYGVYVDPYMDVYGEVDVGMTISTKDGGLYTHYGDTQAHTHTAAHAHAQGGAFADGAGEDAVLNGEDEAQLPLRSTDKSAGERLTRVRGGWLPRWLR